MAARKAGRKKGARKYGKAALKSVESLRNAVLAATLLALFSCNRTQTTTDEAPPPLAAIDSTKIKEAAEKAQARTFFFECEGGRSFTVQVGRTIAWLYLPDRTVDLRRVDSASGVRFQAGSVVFWNKGDDEATLETGAETYKSCRSDPQKAVWEDARVRGIMFRALGNEPGWMLEIDTRRNAVLVADYGDNRYQLSGLDVLTEDDTVTTYVGTGGGHSLRVRVLPGPCGDSMSGIVFEKKVTVAIDDKKYEGCGRELK